MENKSKGSTYTFRVIGYFISVVIFWYILKYIFLWVPSFADILEYFQTPLRESKTWKIIGLISAIGLAITLFHLKKRFVLIFGLIEITGGGWTIWATFTQNFENNVIYALAIAGGIFFIVNGIENISTENNKKMKSN